MDYGKFGYWIMPHYWLLYSHTEPKLLQDYYKSSVPFISMNVLFSSRRGFCGTWLLNSFPFDVIKLMFLYSNTVSRKMYSTTYMKWKKQEDKWIGVFQNKVWILTQDDNHLLYQCHKSTNEENEATLLKSYFRLDIDLNHYYKCWSESDKYFKKEAPNLCGIRILNQDVTENIFSFICSSNNNIKRITLMVEKLCELYGDPITVINDSLFQTFPAVEKLTGSAVEADLRKAGFGYRAKFIHQSACSIEKFGGLTWLENLKLLPYQEAKKELMKLPGVGAKVADCVCLMSLGHLEAVPVDTHIFQVATNTYLPHLKKYKSMTDKVYNEIGDYFRSLHGPYAGWANTVLFCSDLKILQKGIVKKEKIKEEMDENIACKKQKNS